MTFTENQAAFLKFVQVRHGEQVRKYTGEPYWTHVVCVAEILSEVTDQEGLIEVALGHDLVEDTDTTLEDITAVLKDIGYSDELNQFICAGIYHLTDVYTKESYPNFNRKLRKALEAKRLGNIPPVYQTVKYADLIHNSMSIVGRDRGFAKVYIVEKEEILRRMNRGNEALLMHCQNIVKDAKLKLDIN